ncbi:MAG: CBS domain-containing protein [Archaeoglobaceae archaeon]
MRTSVKIARILNIDIYVHWSLFIILAFLAGYFYTSTKPFGFADLEHVERIMFSALASIFVFIAVLLHELAHSLAAMRYGVVVRGIMLFIFGGVAMMEEVPKNPRQELIISLSGPAVSFLICLISLLFSQITKDGLSTFFLISAYFNGIITAFNLIPAFPMDGGRVLRSFLAERMSYVSATRISANVGKAIAVVMGIFGFFFNIWLLLIALFIYLGATEEERIVTMESFLSRFKVGDIMTSNVLHVTPEMTVGDVIDLMFRYKHLGYPVVSDGKLVGIVTLTDLIKAERSKKVEEVMSRNVLTISPRKSAFEAFKIMSEKNIGRLPVVEDDKLVGIITRSDLMKLKEIIEILEVSEWRKA